MKDMYLGQVLEAVEARVSGFQVDNLPITVAIADPQKVVLGVTIQRNYPLAMIERNFGIPFGRLRRDALHLISDPEELHACKWDMNTHATVFQGDATNEMRLNEDYRQPLLALTTGLGNVLQNRRSLAYFEGELSHVVGETPDHLPPYACLVGYKPQSLSWERRVGIELLLFNENGSIERINKADYVQHAAHAVSAGQAEMGVQDQIRWAVSGYPLMLAGERVSLETTAGSVDDYRHLWRLPKLQRSVVQHLARVSGIPDADKHIEFYFGVEELRARDRFVEATHGEAITVPLSLSVPEEWLQTMCSVCQIPEETLVACRAYDPAHKRLHLNPEEVRCDFQSSGYLSRESEDQVREPGDFFIDLSRREVTLKLLPAAYPHHIVGQAEDGRIVNISIAGLSGRSGITIENAKSLCQDIGLTDALVFDNGNDVVARLGAKGIVISHRANRRQTRLTACLHFAYPLDPGSMVAHLEGFAVACSTCSVRP